MANPGMTSFGLTGDKLVDGLTHGYKWSLDASRTIDFSISNGFSGEYWNRPTELATNISAMLTLVSYYADVRFNYLGLFNTPSLSAAAGSEINVSLDGVNRFFSSNSSWAIGFFPNQTYSNSFYTGAAGDIFLNLRSAANALPSYAPGSQGWFLFLHELGHVLGLKHPHDSGGTNRPTFTSLGIGQFDIDWATVMSYNDDGNWNYFSWDPATPMLLDVIALMYLYGKNPSTNLGDTTFPVVETNTYITLWDAGGTDTLDASLATSAWAIALPNQTISNLVDVNIGFALPRTDLSSLSSGVAPRTLEWLIGDYENVIGTNYDDVIIGNRLANQVSAGSGNDEILAGEGDDVITGGAGNDSIDGEAGVDTVVFNTRYTEALITYSSSEKSFSVRTATEGTDTVKNVENLRFSDRTVTSNDIVARTLPTYSLAASSSSVSEGQSATFTLSTTNVSAGTSIAYTISGVSASDTVSGSLSGSVTIGANGQATISIPIAADSLTEGDERLTVTVQNQSVSITINDTSLAPAASYSLSANASSINEGQTLEFTLATTNVSVGTRVPYSITGVSGSDISGAPLSGVFTILAGGRSTLSLPISADQMSEGTEILTLNVQDKSLSVSINDSSKNSTYSLSGPTTVVEGQGAGITLITTDVTPYTQLRYQIFDVQPEDIMGKALSGYVSVGKNGVAWFPIMIAEDYVTEGTETMRVIINGQSLSVKITDNLTPRVASDKEIPESFKVSSALSGSLSEKTIFGSDQSDQIDGASNLNQIIYGFDGDDRISKSVASSTDDVIYGGAGNDYLAPGGGRDTVYGGPGDDVFFAQTGYKCLYGDEGNDLIQVQDITPDVYVDGGAGTDTLRFLGMRFEGVNVKQLDSTTLNIYSVYGSITVSNVERVQLSYGQNQLTAYDLDGNAGKAYRVYKAAFARDPINGDQRGLGYWIAQIDKGMGLVEVASRFVDSNEFRSLYGTNPTNEQFLTKLYTNVLGRQPETSGFNWWLNELNTNPEKTKAKVLADFAESAENQTGVVSLIGNGITYEPWVG